MQISPTETAKTVPAKALELKLAHSPDSDDAFMFYALATRKVRTWPIELTHVLEDIESLNQKALQGVYDITAVSFHAYAHLADQYLLLPCGASFGDGYGPIVVARSPLGPSGLKGMKVAVPGRLTTANLLLRLHEPEVEVVYAPFDQVLDRVTKGEADAGVVIHEGQLTYWREGLKKVLDLGEWWGEKSGYPTPLGANVIRRSLAPEVLRQTSNALRESIKYALEHREEALAYALQFARGMDSSLADRFVSMYVNEWTVDLGARGRQAIQALLDRGFDKGLLPRRVLAEFAE